MAQADDPEGPGFGHGIAHLVGEAARYPQPSERGGLAAAERQRPPMPSCLRELGELARQHTIAAWAMRYLGAEVYGVRAKNTFEAKARDLTGFVRWFAAYNGHGDICHWLPRDSAAYLNSMEASGAAPATVNRSHATLRHFARWAQEEPGQIFAVGRMPMRGVKERVTQEPDCQKLQRQEVHALLKAADAMVRLEGSDSDGASAAAGGAAGAGSGRKNARPRRNRAILAVLFYTGLRVQELAQLAIGQLQGSHLVNVKRKGAMVSKRIFLVAECRRLLEDYLRTERPGDIEAAGGEVAGSAAAPLFVSTVCDGRNPGGHLRRQQVNRMLARIAAQAAALSPKLGTIDARPHRLRHSFGALHRERSGSDAETAAALGHSGLGHVARYIRKTDAERDALMEEVFET